MTLAESQALETEWLAQHKHLSYINWLQAELLKARGASERHPSQAAEIPSIDKELDVMYPEHVDSPTKFSGQFCWECSSPDKCASGEVCYASNAGYPLDAPVKAGAKVCPTCHKIDRGTVMFEAIPGVRPPRTALCSDMFHEQPVKAGAEVCPKCGSPDRLIKWRKCAVRAISHDWHQFKAGEAKSEGVMKECSSGSGFGSCRDARDSELCANCEEASQFEALGRVDCWIELLKKFGRHLSGCKLPCNCGLEKAIGRAALSGEPKEEK